MANEQEPKIVTTPGVLGDGTEEQNLNQPGDPSKRITEDEVDEAFGEKSKD
jgi:hypothetical protein